MMLFSFLKSSTIKYSRNKKPIENINPKTESLNWSFLFLNKNKHISASRPMAIITMERIRLLAKLNGRMVPLGNVPSNRTSLDVANAVKATIMSQRDCIRWIILTKLT